MLLLAALAACAPPPPRAAGTRVVDDAGDAVTVAAPARRVVSLVPATTELLFAIGAGSAVVGRTKWCEFPDSAKLVPNVGDGVDPNLEAVLARKPDLVLLYPSSQNVNARRRLAELGIPALRLRIDHLADVPRLARMLGRVTGHDSAAAALSEAFERELADASAAPGSDSLSVFFLAWDQPTMTVGRGSFLTELIERAGGTNIFGDVAGSSAVVSVEAVAARDPDVILTLGSDAPHARGRPEWQVVKAMHEGRFVHAEGSEFSWPGPRSPLAVRELRDAFQKVER
jgi:iron complex transport system substrate-binding protein